MSKFTIILLLILIAMLDRIAITESIAHLTGVSQSPQHS